MRVLVDARGLLEDMKAGVEGYTLNMLYNLKRMYPNDEYILFSYAWKKKSAEFIGKDFEWIHYRWPNAMASLAWKYLGWPKVDNLVKNIDIVWNPNIRFMPTSKRTKQVATVHDLSFVVMKECFRTQSKFWHWYMAIEKNLKKMDAVVTVSKNTANDVQKYYQLDKNKVKTIYPGLINNIGDMSLNCGMDEYGLEDKKYFLHVGTMEYRKNIKLCLMAYKCYVDNLLGIGITDIPLFVLIGGEGWTFDVEINDLIDVIGQGLVKKMGYVNEKEKIDLIKNANALYYPSFYEGFGFPPLEAILLGVPVISSFGGSLGEVLGSNCLLIDPFDVTGIIKTMNIFGSKKKNIDNINVKKIQLLQKYNWEKAAREFRQLLSEIRDK